MPIAGVQRPDKEVSGGDVEDQSLGDCRNGLVGWVIVWSVFSGYFLIPESLCQRV